MTLQLVTDWLDDDNTTISDTVAELLEFSYTLQSHQWQVAARSLALALAAEQVAFNATGRELDLARLNAAHASGVRFLQETAYDQAQCPQEDGWQDWPADEAG